MRPRSKVQIVAAAMMALWGAGSPAMGARAGAGAAAVDELRLTDADKEPGEWLAVGRTYGEQRFSPLKQINVDTVGKLGLAWYADLTTSRGMEASPLMIDGVLYNVEPWNITTAYDARTGRKLWTFDPKVDQNAGRLACCDIVSRGLAAWKGRIYVGALDGRLIALDAKTGRQLWAVQTFDRSTGNWPYTITGAPRVFDGRVLIGNAGAEGGAPGYVTAYDAGTGRQLWRFHTVPGDPSKGRPDKAMAMAARTWTGEWWKAGGGGTAWDSLVYDPKLKLIYIGTGNGGPWVQRYRSPGGGDNLFLSSIVAVEADTGKYVWHYQETPGDEWDYTATQSMILADLTIGGRLRKVLMQAPKNGFFYVLDRATGELISAKAYVPQTWTTGLDKTGRPIFTPQAHYGEEPVLLSPTATGGHNWNPMAYSPLTGLAYFPALDGSMMFSIDPTFKEHIGDLHEQGTGFKGFEQERKALSQYSATHSQDWLIAWDPVAQKLAWRVAHSSRGSGGVLATAGNLVFQGSIDESLVAYRADNGQKVWEASVQQVPIAAAISYSLDGEQYIAINAGWGGGLAHAPIAQNMSLKLSPTARLLVFKLGGTASLPPLADDGPQGLTRPPPLTASAATIKTGEALFARLCSACHGDNARGGVKDLRRMSNATHLDFPNIVLRGARQSRGMANFSDVLSPADAEAIHQYLISRELQDWDDLVDAR